MRKLQADDGSKVSYGAETVRRLAPPTRPSDPPDHEGTTLNSLISAAFCMVSRGIVSGCQSINRLLLESKALHGKPLMLEHQ